MKKFLRKILGIEEDMITIRESFYLLTEAIDSTFHLKEKDMAIGRKMNHLGADNGICEKCNHFGFIVSSNLKKRLCHQCTKKELNKIIDKN